MFAQMFLDIDAVAQAFYPAEKDRLLVAQNVYQLAKDPTRKPNTSTPVVTLDEVDLPERAVAESGMNKTPPLGSCTYGTRMNRMYKEGIDETQPNRIAPIAHVDAHTVTFVEPDEVPAAPSLIAACFVALGDLARYRGRPKVAERYYAEALENDPSDAMAATVATRNNPAPRRGQPPRREPAAPGGERDHGSRSETDRHDNHKVI